MLENWDCIPSAAGSHRRHLKQNLGKYDWTCALEIQLWTSSVQKRRWGWVGGQGMNSTDHLGIN